MLACQSRFVPGQRVRVRELREARKRRDGTWHEEVFEAFDATVVGDHGGKWVEVEYCCVLHPGKLHEESVCFRGEFKREFLEAL